jgi:hypothetical protein
MNNQQALEKEREKYIIQYEEKFMKIEKVTEDILNDMIAICDNTKHMEEVLKLYDDENDPELNTWVDIEGEGYGWIWVNHPEEQWHEALRNHMIRYIDYKKERIKENDEYVIIINKDKKTIYHFIEREREYRDTIYTFSDEELDL